MLAQQEPFPAVAVDRHWNLLRSNSGAVRLVEFLVGPLAPGTPVNLADALVAPDVLRPHLVNWADVVRYFIRSVEADAAADGTPETAALLERLLAYEGVREALDVPRDESATRRCFPCISARATTAAVVHDHRDARDAAGHHAAGAAHRMLLSHGRGDRRHAARLACSVIELGRHFQAVTLNTSDAYSITSLAATSMVFGTTTPSALAALRLITNSNFVGCRMGRSAGLAPRSIRPV